MTDDAPIEPLGFLGGVTVIDLGDVRVARGQSRRPFSLCGHQHLVYDSQERRVWCKDCEKTLDPFDAFEVIVKAHSLAHSRLVARERRVSEVAAFQSRGLAAKALDEAWRKKLLVPACPHCRRGLLPEDFKNGVGMVDKETEVAFRNRKKEPRP